MSATQGDFLAGDRRFILSTKELAEFMDVATRTVQHQQKHAGLPRLAHNAYDLKEVVKWMVEQAEHKSGFEISDAKEELTKAQTQKYLAETAKLRGLLCDRAHFEDLFVQIASLFATALEGMPSRLSSTLADAFAPNKSREIEKVLTDECDAIRADLTRTVSKHVDSAFAGQPDD